MEVWDISAGVQGGRQWWYMVCACVHVWVCVLYGCVRCVNGTNEEVTICTSYHLAMRVLVNLSHEGAIN